MKKRIFCTLMALIMLVSLVPATALTASAASMTTSEEAVSVIKDLEGYRSKCYADGSQYSIGYGTKCEKSHTGGATHTITENDANTALREELAAVEKAVNNFATANGLSLTQGKFDALVSFSYNCGTAWMNGSGTFKKAVVNGTTGNEFLYAISLWCNDSVGVSNGLLNRRMIEANMYLNGEYGSVGTYTYVKYNGNGGTATDKVQGYNSSSTVAIKASATLSGKTFMGWYTADEGGEWVRSLTSAVKGKTLYAHWQDATNPAYSSVSYKMAASSFTSLQPLSTPSADGTAHGTKLKSTDTVTIVQDFVDANGSKWCRVSGSGWLKVGTLVIEEEKETTTPTNVVVTVTNTYINVRKKASASSAKVGTVNYGDKLTITKVEKASNGALWGKFEDGWVALMYTDYNASAAEDTDKETVSEDVIATAVVSCSSYVNVRKGAGVDKGIAGNLANGTKVNLYEITTVKGHKWGRVSNGWFCLDYATVTMIKEETSDDKKEEDKTSENAIATGTVVCTTVVNVRKAAGVDKKLVGTLANGTDVEIYEISKVKGHEWGRIDEEKWVCLDYVDYTEVAKDETSDDKKEETTTTTALFTGTVIADMNIRKEADAASEQVGTYAKGDKVSVTKVVPGVKKNGTTVAVWGQTDKGWICLTGNVTLDAVKYTVISNTLNVRESAGTTFDSVDKLSKGTVVSISDLTYVGENLWGYSEVFGGWMNITSTYMERTTTSGSSSSNNSSNSTGTDTGSSSTGNTFDYIGTAIVNGVQLNVRNGAGMNYTQVATLNSGAQVKIYELVISNGAAWGRTEQGWIALTYVLFNSTSESANATIVNTYIGVNVRNTAGTAGTLLTKILVNSRVAILEVKTHNGQKWGRTPVGWVCMDYVLLDSDAGANMDDILNGTAGSTGTGSTGSTGSTSTEATALSSYSGTTKEATDVYKAAGSEETVGVTLGANEAITVYELATFTDDDENKSHWARVDEGWILASNVTLKDIEQNYTITNDTLNVRKGPGLTYDKVGKLQKGDVVLVTELAIFEATVWGYVEDEGGWISTSSKYVTLGKVTINTETNTNTNTNANTNTSTNTNTGATGGVLYTGTVYGTSEGLRIRKTASTSSTELGKLKNGSSVKIYEVAVAEYMAWGRCDSGWICLTYVNLDPSTTDAVDTRIVWTEGLSIRAEASVSSDLVGNYAKCTIVDILEVKGDWGRTADGWINLNYLLP